MLKKVYDKELRKYFDVEEVKEQNCLKCGNTFEAVIVKSRVIDRLCKKCKKCNERTSSINVFISNGKRVGKHTRFES